MSAISRSQTHLPSTVILDEVCIWDNLAVGPQDVEAEAGRTTVSLVGHVCTDGEVVALVQSDGLGRIMEASLVVVRVSLSVGLGEAAVRSGPGPEVRVGIAVSKVESVGARGRNDEVRVVVERKASAVRLLV